MPSAGVIHRGLSWCLVLVQPQRPGLAAGVDPGLRTGELGSRESREELWWLASANGNIYEAKTSEICRRSMAARLAVGYFSGGSAGVLCRAGHRELQSWLILAALLFFLLPSHLYLSWLFLSLLGERAGRCVKPKWVVCAVPWRAGETSCSPCFSFSGKGKSSWGVPGVPSWR